MPSTKPFQLSAEPLSLKALNKLISSKDEVILSESSTKVIAACREYLDDKIKREENPIYGINTGFGSLCDVAIEGRDLKQLQLNLVRSHACGTGPEIDVDYVQLMLLLKARGLAYGHSGVNVSTVEQLLFFYNEGISPVVYEQGSLGASGDLAPLAHLSLGLMGEGEVYYKNELRDSAAVLKDLQRKAISLDSKEGIALLNGTQFMLALGLKASFDLRKLAYLADSIGALALEAFDGRPEPFDDLIHAVRAHEGQRSTAARFRSFFEGSQIMANKKVHVQDPYSFRCIPQVHGASKDVLDHAESVFERELNSVTDNPTIFPEADKIISGGNFHGQPLALALDHLAIASAEWANISERRTYLLISGQRNLPAFLVAKPGLNSGLMIAQYTAASIVSQNKQLCHPASVDSIVSSNGQEDHVSMGANAATKLQKVVDNLQTVLAIELLTASQALFFRKDKGSPQLQALLDAFRVEVPFIDDDRIIHEDITKAKAFLEEYPIEIEELY